MFEIKYERTTILPSFTFTIAVLNNVFLQTVRDYFQSSYVYDPQCDKTA